MRPLILAAALIAALAIPATAQGHGLDCNRSNKHLIKLVNHPLIKPVSKRPGARCRIDSAQGRRRNRVDIYVKVWTRVGGRIRCLERIATVDMIVHGGYRLVGGRIYTRISTC
jgi:hypothetical protein